MVRPGWFACAALALGACSSSNDDVPCSASWTRPSVTVESTSQCAPECEAPPEPASYLPVEYTCTADDGSSVACTAFTGSDGTIGCCYATYTDGGAVYDTIEYITKGCAPS